MVLVTLEELNREFNIPIVNDFLPVNKVYDLVKKIPVVVDLLAIGKLGQFQLFLQRRRLSSVRIYAGQSREKSSQLILWLNLLIPSVVHITSELDEISFQSTLS